jgi:AcrR family transcriptional regulator
MQNQNKREQILDAMQELMGSSNAQAISVSDIAQKAGIGKGSIYYYFSSKNDIIDAVIERSYSRVLDAGKELAASSHMDAFKKMELIYHACLDSSTELRRQEAIGTFNEQQESAFIHQKFARIIITRLKPILTDIIRQGMEEGTIHCEYPEETAQIVLTVLTITLDNNLIPADQDQIGRILTAFTQMQEKSMDIPAHTLEFVLRKN